MESQLLVQLRIALQSNYYTTKTASAALQPYDRTFAHFLGNCTEEAVRLLRLPERSPSLTQTLN